MKEERKFEVGDIVELKSGGPQMTVVLEDCGWLKCSWFIDDKSQSGRFPAESLKHANGNKSES